MFCLSSRMAALSERTLKGALTFPVNRVFDSETFRILACVFLAELEFVKSTSGTGERGLKYELSLLLI